MDSDKQADLHARYPVLYSIPVYIDCGDGWFQLIDELSQKLEQMILEQQASSLTVGDDSNQMRAVQVKEKFGGLRFYMDRCTEAMFDAIEEAESRSYRICEICGSPGVVRNGSWITTLCDSHYSHVKPLPSKSH